MKIAVPYIWEVNSIPGRTPLSVEDRNALLNRTFDRVNAVDDEHRLRVLKAFAKRDAEKLDRNGRAGGVRLSPIILGDQ